MNTANLKANWNEVKGKIKQQWGKLTDDDLTRISGNIDETVGSIQKAYGYTKERAYEEFNTFKEKQLSRFDKMADQSDEVATDAVKKADSFANRNN